MSGLQKLCQQYGGMVINGQRWVWDHVGGYAVLERDMPPGSERWRASERAKYGATKPTTPSTSEGEEQ